MAFDFAVITTDGETKDIPMPIALSKVRDVAAGQLSFTANEDRLIAEWALKINDIMSLR